MKIVSSYLPDEVFKEIVDNMPICTVDVVLFNKTKNKIFLAKRNNEPLKGEFFSIGGRLFKNEELEDCAVRQAKTELGISIDKDKLVFGSFTNMITESSIFPETNYHAMDIFFGYIIDETTVMNLDSQHSEFKWFNVKETTFHPYIKNFINTLIPKI